MYRLKAIAALLAKIIHKRINANNNQSIVESVDFTPRKKARNAKGSAKTV
jgi:hypothetical protein